MYEAVPNKQASVLSTEQKLDQLTEAVAKLSLVLGKVVEKRAVGNIDANATAKTDGSAKGCWGSRIDIAEMSHTAPANNPKYVRVFLKSLFKTETGEDGKIKPVFYAPYIKREHLPVQGKQVNIFAYHKDNSAEPTSLVIRLGKSYFMPLKGKKAEQKEATPTA